MCTYAPKTTINRCKLRLRIINNKAACRGKITRFGQYGLAESTGWVGADDGLLVRDLNDNGQIDNGTELFGNNSVLSSGATAASGFEALADLDSNQDGVFNSSDSAWNETPVSVGGFVTKEGTKGNDTVQGSSGSDFLSGNDGDDRIYGGNDKIKFGEGISQNDLSFETEGQNLKILINNDETAGIQISSHFRGNVVETIEFHDGSTLDITNADQLIQAMNSFGADTSSAVETLSDAVDNVCDMYSLAANSGLTGKAA